MIGVANADNEINDLKNKVSTLEGQISSVTKENADNKAKYLRFEAECQALHEKMDKKNKSISQLTIKNEELQALVEKLSSNEEEKDDSKKRLSAQIQIKEEQISSYEKQIQEYENQIKRLKEFERKSETLQDELQSLKLQMTNIVQKLDDTK